MATNWVPWAIGGAVLGGWWLFSKSSEGKTSGAGDGAPAPAGASDCIPADAIKKFATAKGLQISSTIKPVAEWPSGAATAANYRGYSLLECAFYKWNGSRWALEPATQAAYDTWAKSQNLSGHPGDFFLV